MYWGRAWPPFHGNLQLACVSCALLRSDFQRKVKKAGFRRDGMEVPLSPRNEGIRGERSGLSPGWEGRPGGIGAHTQYLFT